MKYVKLIKSGVKWKFKISDLENMKLKELYELAKYKFPTTAN